MPGDGDSVPTDPVSGLTTGVSCVGTDTDVSGSALGDATVTLGVSGDSAVVDTYVGTGVAAVSADTLAGVAAVAVVSGACVARGGVVCRIGVAVVSALEIGELGEVAVGLALSVDSARVG